MAATSGMVMPPLPAQLRDTPFTPSCSTLRPPPTELPMITGWELLARTCTGPAGQASRHVDSPSAARVTPTASPAWLRRESLAKWGRDMVIVIIGVGIYSTLDE